MLKAALVLEGGGMRGVYESGVLDVLLENKLEFEYVIGSSAGALNAANYVSKQAGRSARVNLLCSDDPAYFGLRQFMKSRGSIFNFDYLFHSPVNDLYPYDVEAFTKTEQKFIITATDCETGLPVYFQKRDYEGMTLALRASSSLPLASRIVELDGYSCMDGGLADPVPVRKAAADGNKRAVVILTRDIAYRKKEPNAAMKRTYQAAYRRYPAFVDCLLTRPARYNALVEEIAAMEGRGELFVLRPPKPLGISRTERDARVLLSGYLQGRDDMNEKLEQLLEYVKS